MNEAEKDVVRKGQVRPPPRRVMNTNGPKLTALEAAQIELEQLRDDGKGAAFGTAERLRFKKREAEALKGMKEKGMHPYLLCCFSCDVNGSLWKEAVESLGILETVLTNALINPNEEKYRRLRISNGKVDRCIVKQKGALELLLGYGAVLDEKDEKFGFGIVDICSVDAPKALDMVRVLREDVTALQRIKTEKEVKRPHLVREAAMTRMRMMKQSDADGVDQEEGNK